MDSTIHSASQTLDSRNQKSSFSIGTSFIMFDCLEERNRRIVVERANNGQRYIPEISCQISSEVRGYHILTYETKIQTLHH
jgi:hypothetical protein